VQYHDSTFPTLLVMRQSQQDTDVTGPAAASSTGKARDWSRSDRHRLGSCHRPIALLSALKRRTPFFASIVKTATTRNIERRLLGWPLHLSNLTRWRPGDGNVPTPDMI
jgi:hypothetical protein